MSDTKLVFQKPRGALPVDNSDPRYLGGFGVRSSSSSKIHKVSFDTAQGCWVCSCRGCITHGHCKHLKAIGLKGRSEQLHQPLPSFVDY